MSKKSFKKGDICVYIDRFQPLKCFILDVNMEDQTAMIRFMPIEMLPLKSETLQLVKMEKLYVYKGDP